MAIAARIAARAAFAAFTRAPMAGERGRVGVREDGGSRVRRDALADALGLALVEERQPASTSQQRERDEHEPRRAEDRARDEHAGRHEHVDRRASARSAPAPGAARAAHGRGHQKNELIER